MFNPERRRRVRARTSFLASIACTVLTEGSGAGQADPAAPVLTPQFGHYHEINCTAVSADGRLLATGSDDALVHLWDVQSRSLLRTLRGHTNPVRAVRILANNVVVSGSDDGSAHIWSASDGSMLRTLPHPQPVIMVSEGGDGNVLTGCADERIRVWALSTGELKDTDAVTDQQDGLATRMVVSDDRTIVGVGMADGSVHVRVRSGTGKELHRELLAADPSRVVTAMALSDLIDLKHSAGMLLAAGGSDEIVHVWSLPACTRVATLTTHRSPDSNEIPHARMNVIMDLAFAPRGTELAVASRDASATIHSMTQPERPPLKLMHMRPVSGAVFVSDGLITTTNEATLWKSDGSDTIGRFATRAYAPTCLAVSADGRRLVIGTDGGAAYLWSLADSGNPMTLVHPQPPKLPAVHPNRYRPAAVIESVEFSSDGDTVFSGDADGHLRIWSSASGRFKRQFEYSAPVTALLGEQGETVLVGTGDRTLRRVNWRHEDLTVAQRLPGSIRYIGRGGGGASLVIGTGWTRSPPFVPGRIIVVDGSALTERYSIATRAELLTLAAISEGYRVIAAAGDVLKAYSINDLSEVGEWPLPGRYPLVAIRPSGGEPNGIVSCFADGMTHFGTVDAPFGERFVDATTSLLLDAAVSARHDAMFVAANDGTVSCWAPATKAPRSLCHLLPAGGNEWAVIAPDGRFDTGNLEEVASVRWVVPDDPFRALPPEIYLRDYYEPKLLSKLLNGVALAPVRPLQELNRAQPRVTAVRVAGPGAEPGTVDVEVDVRGGEYRFEDGSRTDVTEAYDLRLLRDGLLVGRWPPPKDSTPDGVAPAEVAQWQADTRVAKTTVSFKGVRLPHRPADEPVQFTAYAFNKDRVKGPTSEPVACPPLDGAAEPVAYLACVGVDDYGGGGWDLGYAADDARAMAAALERGLAGYHVVPEVLVTDGLEDGAGKERIREAIEQVAARARPDDLVLVFFAGHGFGTASGDFYLLPAGSRPWEERDWGAPSPETLARCVSAEELARWVRGIDAGEVVLVIDACQAAGAVDKPGFKPGPLGNRGLGQLAYDKRMRVLAASQSDQAAREIGGAVGHGALTCTLVTDALQSPSPADADGNGTLTLGEWLAYPVGAVPALLADVLAGRRGHLLPAARGAESIVAVTAQPAAGQDNAVQVPELFDFARHRGKEVQIRR